MMPKTWPRRSRLDPRQLLSTSHFRHAVVHSTHLSLTPNQTLEHPNVFSSTTPDLTLSTSQCNLAQYLCCLRVYRQQPCTHFWSQVCDFCPGRVGRSAQSSPLLYAQTATTPGIYLKSTFHVQSILVQACSDSGLTPGQLVSRKIDGIAVTGGEIVYNFAYTVKPSSCICLVPFGDDRMR